MAPSKIRLAYMVLATYAKHRQAYEAMYPNPDDSPFPTDKAFFQSFADVYGYLSGIEKATFHQERVNTFFEEINPFVTMIKRKRRAGTVKGLLQRLEDKCCQKEIKLDPFYPYFLKKETAKLHPHKREKYNLVLFIDAALSEQREADRLGLKPSVYREEVIMA